MDEKLLYRIDEVAHYLSCGRSKTYELVRAGHIPSVRIDGVFGVFEGSTCSPTSRV